VPLNDYTVKSFRLKAEIGDVNTKNEQCLIYYYYLSNVIRTSITVLKETVTGTNETIDHVTSSPFNGWIERRVTFFAIESMYKVY
jgi:hypothetical protein